MQMHLMVHAFKKDVNDPERTGFHESHVGFYYNKYYKQSWTPAAYGCKSFDKVVDLIKEGLTLNSTHMLEAVLSEDTAPKHFVQLVEEHRRDRQRCIDAGDETA